MSTFISADLGSDSDPEDGDFRPTAPKKRKLNNGNKDDKGSASGSGSDSDSGSSDNEEDVEGGTGTAEAVSTDPSNDERRRNAEAAMRALREEVTVQENQGGEDGKVKEKEIELVEIKRARRFAGETIYETVKLPASDPEAIAYLAKQSRTENPGNLNSALSTSITPAVPDTSSEITIPPSLADTASRPKHRAPIRKKPRQSLEQMASALDKGKKMTTLEKSQMDWKNHTSSSANLADELAANRRSGGQLGNREFLDRVGERRAGGAAGGGRR